jgi:hypothetical protein
MPIAPEARQRLARLMDERRRELRLRWQDVAETGGISLKTLHSVRAGGAGIAPLTESGIEIGLQWEAGSIGLIFDGGEPVPIVRDEAQLASLERGVNDLMPDMDAAMKAQVERQFPAIEALIISAAVDGSVTDGSRIFADPHEAQRWDNLIEVGRTLRPGEGFSLWQLATLMAVGRVRDDERRARTNPAHLRKA